MASEHNLCLALYINVQISCKRLFLSVDRQALFKRTILYHTYNSVLKRLEKLINFLRTEKTVASIDRRILTMVGGDEGWLRELS